MFLLSEKLICHPFTSNPDVLSHQNLVKRMLPATRHTAVDNIYLYYCYICVTTVRPQKRAGRGAQDQSLRRHQRRQHRRGEQDLQL